MADKRTHFGRAGEYFAMSELLLRGWNVAVPVVDVGDDVFVIDDNDKTTFRLQVKAAEGVPWTDPDAAGIKASFGLSRSQLRTPQPIELFYMLVVRLDSSWRFLVIPRQELFQVRATYLASPDARVGRPSLADEDAKTDSLMLNVGIRGDVATGWGDLSAYLDRWPERLAPVKAGPGTVRRPSA